MDRREFDYKLDGLLTESERLIPQEKAQNLPDSKIFPGVPQWHPFENSLWMKGEAIRKLILESGKKPNPEQVNRICSICIDPNGGRGRQSFVMLLGRTGYASFAPMVAELLSDCDVDGQAVDTLYKMRVQGYAEQIRPFAEHRHTWIRNIAKKYLEKYGGQAE